MNRSQLFAEIKGKGSYLCVGLDTDLTKIPTHLLTEKDPVFEFNKQIIDATHEFCIAYKPNLAFYEALGLKGWESLQKTLDYIPPSLFTIADAKRGDIGNTSALYASAFFEQLTFDAVTVAPYMGEDSIKPFLKFNDKWAIVLAHTSNPGAADFQLIESKISGRKLYEEVLLQTQKWGSPDRIMFVVGATQADKIQSIRTLAPDYFFLVPGVGAQGGDLEQVSRFGINKECGLIVNSARAILYASNDKDFAKAAMQEAKKMKEEMTQYLDRYLA
jgi:orotidine-5'-phosphate decarboxylase